MSAVFNAGKHAQSSALDSVLSVMDHCSSVIQKAMLVVGEKRCLSRGPTLAMAQCGGYRVLNVNGGSESAEARCEAVATPSDGS